LLRKALSFQVQCWLIILESVEEFEICSLLRVKINELNVLSKISETSLLSCANLFLPLEQVSSSFDLIYHISFDPM
jgi:hypothetical protein